MSDEPILQTWSDTEIVLLALAINSGVTMQGAPGAAAAAAEQVNDGICRAVEQEMRRRELHPPRLASELFRRAAEAVTQTLELPGGQRSDERGG